MGRRQRGHGRLRTKLHLGWRAVRERDGWDGGKESQSAVFLKLFCALSHSHAKSFYRYLSAYTTPSRTAISGVVFELNSADYGNDIFVETGSTLTSVVVRSCETLQVSSATVLPQCEDLSCVRTTDNAQWGLLTKSRRNATSTCKALCKNATPPQESAQCYYVAPPVPASGFVVA